MSNIAWHICSYPRSGNHLVRAIIEFATCRPTIGCPEGGEVDRPIYQREPNALANLIEIVDPNPVGYKSHIPREFHLHDRAGSERLGVILITRNPRHAISSQVYRKLKWNHWFSAQRLEEEVTRDIDQYLAVVHLFRSMRVRPHIHLQFEKLLEEQSRHEEIDRLLEVTGAVRSISRDQMDQVYDLARQSQASLGKPNEKKKMRLEKIIESKLEYGYILNLLS